jgi:hypothetical protein
MLRTEGGKFQSEACADAIPDGAIQLDWNSLAGQLEFDGDLFAWQQRISDNAADTAFADVAHPATKFLPIGACEVETNLNHVAHELATGSPKPFCIDG